MDEIIYLFLLGGGITAGYFIRGWIDSRGNTEKAIQKRIESLAIEVATWDAHVRAYCYSAAEAVKRDVAKFKLELELQRLKNIRNKKSEVGEINVTNTGT